MVSVYVLFLKMTPQHTLFLCFPALSYTSSQHCAWFMRPGSMNFSVEANSVRSSFHWRSRKSASNLILKIENWVGNHKFERVGIGNIPFFRLRLWLRGLLSSEKKIVGVLSRSGGANQLTSFQAISFYCDVGDGAVSGIDSFLQIPSAWILLDHMTQRFWYWIKLCLKWNQPFPFSPLFLHH